MGAKVAPQQGTVTAAIGSRLAADAEGQEAVGYYARIWQLRPQGWRLVFDQIVPHRAPPPAN